MPAPTSPASATRVSPPAAFVALLLLAASAAAVPQAGRGDSFGTIGATIGSLLQMVAAASPSVDAADRGRHRETPRGVAAGVPSIRSGERGFGGTRWAERLRQLANTPPPAA